MNDSELGGLLGMIGKGETPLYYTVQKRPLDKPFGGLFAKAFPWKHHWHIFRNDGKNDFGFTDNGVSSGEFKELPDKLHMYSPTKKYGDMRFEAKAVEKAIGDLRNEWAEADAIAEQMGLFDEGFFGSDVYSLYGRNCQQVVDNIISRIATEK